MVDRTLRDLHDISQHLAASRAEVHASRCRRSVLERSFGSWGPRLSSSGGGACGKRAKVSASCRHHSQNSAASARDDGGSCGSCFFLSIGRVDSFAWTPWTIHRSDGWSRTTGCRVLAGSLTPNGMISNFASVWAPTRWDITLSRWLRMPSRDWLNSSRPSSRSHLKLFLHRSCASGRKRTFLALTGAHGQTGATTVAQRYSPHSPCPHGHAEHVVSTVRVGTSLRGAEGGVVIVKRFQTKR